MKESSQPHTNPAFKLRMPAVCRPWRKEVLSLRSRITDSIPCAILLALSGGCMDAYSYLFRDHVFANAQTGNILLFAVNLADGDLSGALKYFSLTLSFVAGIKLADLISRKKTTPGSRRLPFSVLFEALLLFLTAFLPVSLNAAANMTISFVCGIQLENFRELRGHGIATTMCIGNLRNGTYYLDKYIQTHSRPYLRRAALYFGIIALFAAGAVIESKLIRIIGTYAIWFSSVLLIASALLMFREARASERDPIV